MGAFTIFPLMAIVTVSLFSLAAVTFICGIILLGIKLINKNGHHPKVILPVSVFLMISGVFTAIATVFFLGKFIGIFLQ